MLLLSPIWPYLRNKTQYSLIEENFTFCFITNHRITTEECRCKGKKLFDNNKQHWADCSFIHNCWWRQPSSDAGGQPDSVCEGAQDEEAIFLLPDPLQQFVDSRDSLGLGPERTEAEVELKATCRLQDQTRDRTRYGLSYFVFSTPVKSKHKQSFRKSICNAHNFTYSLKKACLNYD